MENEKRLNELMSTPRVIGSRALIDVAWGRLPNRPGIYIVMHPEYGILYIGKAKSLRERCKRRAWFLGKIHVVWFDLDRADHDLVEKHLIQTLEPEYNVANNSALLKRRRKANK